MMMLAGLKLLTSTTMVPILQSNGQVFNTLLTLFLMNWQRILPESTFKLKLLSSTDGGMTPQLKDKNNTKN